MQVGPSQPLNPTFVNQLQQITADGKISRDEFKNLQQMVKGLDVPESEKAAFLKLADKMKDYTNVGFFNNGTLEKSEMAELEKMAEGLKDSKLVSELFSQFKDAANPVEDKSFFGAIGDFFKNLFSWVPSSEQERESDCQFDVQGRPGACFDPNSGFQMPGGAPGTPGATGPGGTTGVGAPPTAPGDSSTFTSQWSERGLGATHVRESQANCGPASASMIMKQLGLPAPSMHEIRQMVGGRISTSGNEGGAFAIGTEQLAEAVKKQAAAQGRTVTSTTQSLPANSQQALAQIKEKLDRGEKVVLLTGGFGGTPGHYTVIKAVNPDGTFVVDDPARGPNQVRTAAELQTAMDNRRAAGRGISQIISFSG